MKAEEQVISLNLAQKLKELGVPQESLFYWCKEARIYAAKPWIIVPKDDAGIGNSKVASAFTVAELGELTKGVTETYYSTTWEKWACGMRNTEDHCPIFFEATEADARAKMLIDLKEKENAS